MWEDIENPTFVIDTPETSASIVQDALSVKTSKEDENKTVERLAFRLNFLQDKNARCESHKSFLKRCYDEKLIPYGLHITLKLSIGNVDDAFNTKWYERLNNFSLTLMEDNIEHSQK